MRSLLTELIAAFGGYLRSICFSLFFATFVWTLPTTVQPRGDLSNAPFPALSLRPVTASLDRTMRR